MKKLHIALGLGSTSQTYRQSFGEVKLAETFDKKGAPVEGGLFCHKIFGVLEEYTCACRKYHGEKSKSGVCESCGAELLSRLELGARFGHISLAVPVIHPWFYRAVAALLALTEKELDAITTEKMAWVSAINNLQKIPLSVGALLTEEEQHTYWKGYGDDAFEVETGLEVIQRRLSEVELEALYQERREQLSRATSQARRVALKRELQVIEALYLSKQSPRDLMIEELPVLPALYRQQEEASTKEIIDDETGEVTIEQDLSVTSLYKKVIQRNARLKKLKELSAPAIILRNEKEMLSQLIRELFSGIQSKFSQNPQEKTVDYSGHAAVAVDPSREVSQCGVPIEMARTLWGPFLMARIRDEGLAESLDEANLLLDGGDDDALTILQEEMTARPVLLSAMAPSARAMLPLAPVLAEGEAISVHPLVARHLSLSPDGEHVALHVLLSPEAKREATQTLGVSSRLLSPINLSFDWRLSTEALFGLFSLTREPVSGADTKPRAALIEEIAYAYESGLLQARDEVVIRHQGQKTRTTAGRVLLASIAPKEIDFSRLNQPQTQGSLMELLSWCAEILPRETTASFVSRLEALGASIATRAGASLCIEDFVVATNKEEVLQRAQSEVDVVIEQYCDGLITEGERYNKIIELWSRAAQLVQQGVNARLEERQNTLWALLRSSQEQPPEQLCAMAGLFVKSSGELLDTPGVESLREGFATSTFFFKSIQVRTNTLREQYLTERTKELQEKIARVTREVRLEEEDCETSNGLMMTTLWPGESLAPYLRGRHLARDIGPHRAPLYITNELAESIASTHDKGVWVRSPLTCESRLGVCRACAGVRGIQQDALGFFAAHAIQTTSSLAVRTQGSSSIQTILTLHQGTFHLVNTKIALDSAGERRVISRGSSWVIKRGDEVLCERELFYGLSLEVEDGQRVEAYQTIATYDEALSAILAEQNGIIDFGQTYPHLEYTIDQTTGLSHYIVKEPKLDTDPYPSIQILDPRTRAVLITQYVPIGAIIVTYDGAEVKAGDLLAKIHHKRSLQVRSAHELFEVVTPASVASLAAFPGTISYRRTRYERGELVRVLLLTSPPEDGAETREYLISAWQKLLVQEGETVTAGTMLSEGEIDLQELLEVAGPSEVARFFLKHLRRQAQTPPQHIELILRRMLSFVRISASGDSGMEEGEILSRVRWQEEVDQRLAQGQTPPIAEPLLLGVSALRDHQRLSLRALYEATAKELSRLALSGQRIGE